MSNHDMSPALFFPPQLSASASCSKHPGKPLENNSEMYGWGFQSSHPKQSRMYCKGTVLLCPQKNLLELPLLMASEMQHRKFSSGRAPCLGFCWKSVPKAQLKLAWSEHVSSTVFKKEGGRIRALSRERGQVPFALGEVLHSPKLAGAMVKQAHPSDPWCKCLVEQNTTNQSQFKDLLIFIMCASS